ncbi:MAG: DUF4249 family protein [Muribaculaceae bacterium]|nr:DUF4249 family protein [Muribaculaceae bacterium]
MRLKRHSGICALALSLLPLATSCLSEPEAPPTMAVIDGWFDSDGYPVVQFTASLEPSQQDQSIADKMIRWGLVTISDGDTTIVMTGAYDRRYFPPFRYYTTGMTGVPGKTYTVTVKYEDLYAEASCLMPVPTPIDSITIERIEGNDTLRAGNLHFTAPADVPAYYYLQMRDDAPGSRPYPTMLGTARAEVAGAKMTIPLFNPKNQLDSLDFIPQLKVGQRVQVKLCRITEEVYEFWNSYDNATMFGGSQFLTEPGGGLGGNVSGGYGIWSPQGVASEYIRVE